ncbi:hypothetical protein BGY98DRAFT_329083 [Russula aff. rugulosa BPL654]|nr:hypothetical protein BGY98DRAFT_329083 [Russula aff. rugulosa BPL654]
MHLPCLNSPMLTRATSIQTYNAGSSAPNALRDIVLPPSFITRILSVTGVSGLSGPTTDNMSAFSSPIPWRRAGVRYNNQVYFNIVETLVTNSTRVATFFFYSLAFPSVSPSLDVR